MKAVLSLAILLFFINNIHSQTSSQHFTFKEIGWSLTLPSTFQTLDSITTNKQTEDGKRLIEQANNVTADFSGLKTLISASKNTSNVFYSTITAYDPEIDGEYSESNQLVKDMLYRTFTEAIPGAKIDSSSSKESIDGVRFEKYKVIITVDSKPITMVILSGLYKGYDFGISYVYLDEATREEIELMLKRSRFSK